MYTLESLNGEWKEFVKNSQSEGLKKSYITNTHFKDRSISGGSWDDQLRYEVYYYQVAIQIDEKVYNFEREISEDTVNPWKLNDENFKDEKFIFLFHKVLEVFDMVSKIKEIGNEKEIINPTIEYVGESEETDLFNSFAEFDASVNNE